MFRDARSHVKYNYKILMLGGTGAGKTSFLNLLNNVTLATQSITNIKTLKAFNKAELENLNGGSMSSKTSDAARYEFDIGYARFTVIDTPGFGDTRGELIDAENFEKIKKIVLDEQGINCVCIV